MTATVTAIRAADVPKVTKNPMEMRVLLPGREILISGFIEGDPALVERSLHDALRERGFTHTCLYVEEFARRDYV